MNVLVTGSEGLIGRRVMVELERHGHRAFGFDTINGKDVNDKDQLLAALRPMDAVIHLASPSSPLLFDRDPDRCWHQTVATIHSILDGFRGRVVCPSSGKVYGSLPEPAREDMWLPRRATPYAAAKRECERLCLQAIARGQDVRIPRIFACYGGDESHKFRENYASTPYTFVRHALAGEKLVLYRQGRQRRDFVHIDDIARGLVAVLETDSPSRIFNLGSGRAVTFQELVDMINTTTGRTLQTVDGEPPSEGYSDCMLADVSRARAELSWRAEIRLEEGIARLVAQLRDPPE